MASPQSDPAREYRLIEQLELRIANADTDEKFENILHKFLAPLLLKVGSTTAANRNLAIKVCQYVNQRLKINKAISLPVQTLLKTFRAEQNAFVKRFALLFVEQALSRLQATEAVGILSDVLQNAVPQSQPVEGSDAKMWSIAFDFLLQSLSSWKLPEHQTKEDEMLKHSYALTDFQSELLSSTFSHFLLFDPKSSTTHGASDDDMKTVFNKHFQRRTQVIVPISRFLFSSIFSDQQRLIPATILSVDANESANSIGDAMFKQCSFDLEIPASIDALFELYNFSRPRLQTRILSLLCKSQMSTRRTSQLVKIVEERLFDQSGGLESSKLRAAVFSYLNWAIRISKNLYTVRERLQTVLKEFIELQGWPKMPDATTVDGELRSRAYESIGLLATVQSHNPDEKILISIDLVSWLFTSLRCDTTRDAHRSIDEALSRVLSALVLSDKAAEAQLKALLLWNVLAKEGDEDPTYFYPTKFSTRHMAVRFANRCLAFGDIDARTIDVLAMTFNDHQEVVEEANRGLNPYWHRSYASLISESNARAWLVPPNFNELVDRLFGDLAEPNLVCQNSLSLNAAVLFSRNILAVEALKTANLVILDQDDWVSFIDSKLATDLGARTAFLSHIRGSPITYIGKLVEGAILAMHKGSHEAANLAMGLVGLCSNEVLISVRPEARQWLESSLSTATIQHAASRIYGVLISLSASSLHFVLQALETCAKWQSAVGEESVRLRGYISAATSVLTRTTLRGLPELEDRKSAFEKLFDITSQIVTGTRDKALKTAAYRSLGQLGLCIGIPAWTSEDSEKLLKTFLTDAKAEDEVAVTALGRVINAAVSAGYDTWVESCFEQLYNLHEIKKAEFHFAVGECLSVAAQGFHSSSTISEFDVDAPKPRKGYHPVILEKILQRCLAGSKATKPSLKKASAIWLLCLIQYCQDNSFLKSHLRNCQSAFARLLSDRDEIVQETGSRGLSLVYEKGDKHLRDDLVRELVQSFTGGSTKLSGAVEEDTQLFEAGVLPTEGGQSVQTYKDIVSLATEMGDPTLVYRFMNLASNNAIWSSRAAFGRFGLSGVLADSSYLEENKKFYPKLFRYRFDPNPNVQRSMNEIWKALVKDPNQVVEENFGPIMEDLLKSIVSGKDWRAREASCGAISDLVQGRDVDKFENYLDAIWKVTFKVLDDVKESVRAAALKLHKTLISMLVRNLEVGDGTSKRARTMLSHALPFLLQQIDGAGGQEVQQYAIVSILDIVKKCPLRALKPSAPVILERLILSMSSLEHESINYVHLNADKYGLTTEKLDQMRVSSINASPLTEAIDRCLDSLSEALGENSAINSIQDTHHDIKGDSYLEDSMQRLENTFKSAIGLPSKVGLSRVIVTLVVRHHSIFRPFADRFTRLTRKTILDRNATISVSFSMALAYLMRLATDREVQQTSQYAQNLYFGSQELAHRAVAGEIVQAISKVSSDVLRNYATVFLPFVWIGCHDLDADVRARFDEPWKDTVGGPRSLQLYLREIVTQITEHITSSLWPIRQACCLAVADLLESMHVTDQYSEAEAKLLWPVVVEALNGKTWQGKEKVIAAYPKYIQRATLVWQEFGKQMKLLILREAKRNNSRYRAHALTALGEVVWIKHNPELAADAMSVVTNAVGELDELDSAMDLGDNNTSVSDTRVSETTWCSVIQCLFQIVSVTAEPRDLEQAIIVVRKGRQQKSAQIDMQIREGARQCLTRAAEDPSSVGPHETKSCSFGNAEDQSQVAPAAFLEQLTMAILNDDRGGHESDTESVRKSRVELLIAMANSTDVNETTLNTLADLAKAWYATERSRPLKLELEKALAAINPRLTHQD